MAVKSFRVQLCDALSLLVAILAIGLGILSFGWLGLDASHKIIVWVSAGLSLLLFTLVGRLSIWQWSRRQLSGVSQLAN